MNISHTIYPDREYTFNEIMENIYIREHINIEKPKELKITKELGYFKVKVFKQLSISEFIKSIL